MMICKDVEKTFDKIQHSFIIKTLSKLRIGRNFPQCDNEHLRKSYS